MSPSTRAITLLINYDVNRLAPYLATDYDALEASNPHLHDHMLDKPPSD